MTSTERWMSYLRDDLFRWTYCLSLAVLGSQRRPRRSRSERDKAWRLANPEKVRAQKRRYREKHFLSIRKYYKAWMARNPEKRLSYALKYVNRDPDISLLHHMLPLNNRNDFEADIIHDPAPDPFEALCRKEESP